MHVRRTPAAGAMNADPGPSTTSVPATARAQDIENLFGGSARDVLTRSSVADRIFGGDGDDIHRFSGDSGRAAAGLPSDSAQTALKHRLGSTIRRELQAVTTCSPRVEVPLSGPLAGTEPQNIVNRVTVAGNGIQLEQPLAVRANPRQRMATARAVADFYWAPMAGRSHPTQEERDADER
jgi:hypothetical protein